jgi:tetratricopeptide (TPR) repeat protein
LVNVTDGYHLWSERYDRELEDVFAIQDEIAENIVKALRVVLSDAEKRAIEKKRTDNVQAYDYYLRGRQFFHQWRRRSVEYARRMFERAIEVDPNYALAYAGIADCCSFIYIYWDASSAHLEQAQAASRKALELDPESAEVHSSRGMALAFAKRYQEAELEFETAIRLNPKLFEAHYFFGRSSFQQGNVPMRCAITRRPRGSVRRTTRPPAFWPWRIPALAVKPRQRPRTAALSSSSSVIWNSTRTTLERLIWAQSSWFRSVSATAASSGPGER